MQMSHSFFFDSDCLIRWGKHVMQFRGKSQPGLKRRRVDSVHTGAAGRASPVLRLICMSKAFICMLIRRRRATVGLSPSNIRPSRCTSWVQAHDLSRQAPQSRTTCFSGFCLEFHYSQQKRKGTVQRHLARAKNVLFEDISIVNDGRHQF